MRYRVLWAGAIGGIVVQLAVLGAGIVRSGASIDDAAVIAALAITLVSLAGIALAWFGDGDRLGQRWASLARLGSVGVVAAATVAALAFATFSTGDTNRPANAAPSQALVSAAAPASGALPADESAAHVHDSTTTAATADNPMGEGAAHTHGNEVPITEEQLAAAATFVANVKADTAKYADIQAAFAGGYVQLTQDLPGIAAHFVNPRYLADGEMMNPEKPEFLLYTKRLDGNWRLVGTMFYDEKNTEAAPSYFGPLDQWHLHENLCFVGAAVRTVTAAADCKGGLYVAKTAWQLHVWVVPSPTGVFSHDLATISPGAFPGAVRPAAQDLVANR
jgi:hypothetical protein